jgi:hypothetical protein
VGWFTQNTYADTGLASMEARTVCGIRNKAFLLFWLLVAFIVPAQASARRPVAVSCSCDDPGGKAYAKALHEALTTSAVYREADLVDVLRNGGFRISIVSLPLDTEAKGDSARVALSIVCVHDGAILHQLIETCTRIPIDSCAKTLLVDLENWK